MSLKDFKILSKLGEGIYSSVYKVERIQDGIQYALKKVTLLSLPDSEIENALNQVRILASLNHSNIIGYKQVFIDNNYLCLIMQFADDGDLYQRIVQYKRNGVYFQEKDIWNMFINILSALKTLHSLNILHRDLKSANVYLTKDEGAKLGNMNAAKIVKNQQLQTQNGTTPYYASPEIWKNEPYDSKADMWSLGCVLYEMTTLRPPFRAQDMQGLYVSVTKCVYPKIQNNYSIQLSNIIKYLLQQNPNYRPSAEILINSPQVKKKIQDYNIKLQHEIEENHLMKTIKWSKNNNYHQLIERLPKPNYPQRSISHGRMEKGPQNYEETFHEKHHILPKIVVNNNLSHKLSRSIKRTNKVNVNVLEISGHSKILEPTKIDRKFTITVRQHEIISPKKISHHKIQPKHQNKNPSFPPIQT